jgi:hypothetical protein
MDERIDLASETRLTVGERVPLVQNVTKARGGMMFPSVSYQRVGCIVDVIGRWKEGVGPTPTANIELSFHMSDVSDPGVPINGGVRLPAFVELSMERELQAESGRPILSATLRPNRSEAGEVDGYFACIVRLQLDRLQ